MLLKGQSVNRTPKVSVITPVFNTAPEKLCNMIDSILSQTFTDFEFLILNDSPDNKTLDDILLKYKDPRIKYIKNKKNIGLAKSTNKLFSIAKGKYIAITAHDDISLPTRLEKQVDFLDQNPHVGLVYANVIVQSPNHKQTKLTRPSDNFTLKLEMMRQKDRCLISHTCCMIRTSLLNETNIKFEEEYFPCCDYRFYMQLMPHTIFHNLPDYLVIYNSYPENTSHKYEKLMIDMAGEIWMKARANNPFMPYTENKQTKYLLFGKILLFSRENGVIKLFGLLPIIKIQKRY